MSTDTASKRLPPFKPYLRQAIRDGRKTMTRRIVKPQPFPAEKMRVGAFPMPMCATDWIWPREHGSYTVSNKKNGPTGWVERCPYGQVGDRVHLIEPLRREQGQSIVPYAVYADDGAPVEFQDQGRSASYPLPVRLDWRWSKSTLSSIHMPTEAARWFGRITEIRVERVQEITSEDAMAEGALEAAEVPYIGGMTCDQARDAFRLLWEHINGAESWSVNPWCWVLRFEAEA